MSSQNYNNDLEDDYADLDNYRYNNNAHQNSVIPEPERVLTKEEYLQELTQAWINERAAPEILKYQEIPITGLMERIDEQLMAIDELDSGNDTSMILSILYQTELERVKYVIRSYLRTRLSKIERYCQHFLADEDLRKRMSEAEQRYAETYKASVAQHQHSSFLSSLPTALQGQTDVVFERQLSMVPKPVLSEAVFCRIVKEVGEYYLPGSADLMVELKPGQIYIFQYNDIRLLLERGSVHLI